jgi:hypothetical protein
VRLAVIVGAVFNRGLSSASSAATARLEWCLDHQNRIWRLRNRRRRLGIWLGTTGRRRFAGDHASRTGARGELDRLQCTGSAIPKKWSAACCANGRHPSAQWPSPSVLRCDARDPWLREYWLHASFSLWRPPLLPARIRLRSVHARTPHARPTAPL